MQMVPENEMEGAEGAIELAPELLDGAEGAIAIELTPEEIEEMERLEREEAARLEQSLDALSITLAKSRSDAIAARQASGIEDEWEADEEHYEGIDDVNRGERRSSRGKPVANQTGQKENEEATSSTVFINITRPYVDAASARVSDMLLPTDDRSWGIEPTPIPELSDMAKGKFPERLVAQAVGESKTRQEAESKLHSAVEEAVAEMEEATKRASAAQKRIEDWHVQCQFHGEVRKVIEDATKIGTGILKGPIPIKKKQVAFVGGKIVMREEIQPASLRVDPWNFYPDPACGENIHNGSFCWERDDITEKGLMDLKGAPGYINSQIEKVLVEGWMKATKEAPDRPLPDGFTPEKRGMFEIWYFHGMLKREDFEAIGCKCPGEEFILVPAQVTMVNNRVIRAIINPLDTAELPYDVMVWQKRTGHWAGIGVSRQIRTPQEIVVAAGRNLMDNAGRAGGPQVIVKQGIVVPQDGIYEVTPWKFWLASEDSDLEHVDKAFRFVTIDMMQDDLQAIIRMGLKLAEDVTGLPLLLQGQQGKAPETLGGMQLLNNNASTVLRRVARIFDDSITEPHVRRYYRYLLQYGEDDSEKGDFQIDARGSSALVQRDIENQSIGEMANMIANPIFGLDPKKWAEEWLKSKHLDPNRFKFDDKKWQQIIENMSQGAQDPRLAVAQLRGEIDMKLKQMDQAFDASENKQDRELTAMVELLKAESNREGISEETRRALETIKGRLGDTVLKLRAQRQMQLENRAVQLSKPPTEPAGKADKGEAYIA